ncbi:hypothetical protein PsYK624_153580 [Phanerochaete sordida]|uniref:DUF6534 domain-containing protein n=1 Tax=Phanerochaete sordida TaxID=48140 RepID=A0A9P3GPE2_9APHY|nr:hypothetical protein PsYK624_153580 [Phanerochaete sordida]
MALSVEQFAGPLFVCICVALILFGVFTTQVYFYWGTYEEDTTPMKFMVLSMWLLEAVHTVFCIDLMYQYFIRDFGNADALDIVPWTVGGTVFLEITIVAMCQGFYIVRIWHLSHNNKLATLVPTVTLACRLVFGLATGSLLYRFTKWDQFRQHKGPLATLNCGLALAAVVDLLCTLLLTYYLRQHRTSFRRTRRMVQTLIFYTVNTGALTMAFSVAILFMFNFVEGSLLFAGMVEIVSKLYANSAVAMINARQHIKNQSRGDGSLNTIPLSIRGPPSYGNNSETDRVRVAIFKDTITDTAPGGSMSTENGKESLKSGFNLA